MPDDRPPLAGGSLDRDAASRLQPEALAAAWSEPGALVLRLRAAEVPVVCTDDGPRLALVAADGEYATRGGGIFLGRVDGAAVFAVEVSGPGVHGESWQHPFEAVSRLGETDRQLIAVASALLRWHESAGFSPRDGSPTQPAQGGWARIDPSGGEHFPRTDPAVIVLIEHEDRILLGSNVLWEEGRFSLLAGFVEAGESLEQAVVREVFEEAGMRLGEVEYVASQPWPFPRSLMIGFRAGLAAGVDPNDLRPDPTEISELRWFAREELRRPSPGLKLPRPLSIARWLIDGWLAEGGGANA